MSGRARNARTATRPGAPASGLPLAAARSGFVRDVRRALFGPCAVTAGSEVIVGVSGGADSMALMLALAAIAWRSTRTGGVLPVVVHVHHHLRGRAADLDAAFVEREATRLGLPFERRDVHPARERGSRAAAARRLRYAALAEAARARAAATVAVAHHAEDQLESILMAIARGTGLDGLAGMAARRPLEDETAIALVRPLLLVGKAECEAFCRAAGRRWRRDASNLERSSPRVRLRRDVLPVLESLWPGAASRASTTAELARQVLAVVEERAPRPVAVSGSRAAFRRADLASQSIVVAGRALRRAYATLLDGKGETSEERARRLGDPVASRPQLESIHVTEAISLAGQGRSGMHLAWPGGVRVGVSRDQLVLSRQGRQG